MPLITCPECNSKVSDRAPACIHCGYPILQKSPESAAPAPTNAKQDEDWYHDNRSTIRYAHARKKEELKENLQVIKVAKSRGVYIILGLLFGMIGIHNFYAGYYSRGVIQLLTVLILGWVIIGFVVVGIWVLIELIVVTKDKGGQLLV